MPNLAGLIFSTVSQYVLQPQKTKRRVKRDDLDTLSEVYVGPAGGEDFFAPPIGTPHPQYNLMTLIDVSIKQLPALVVEVTLDYHGKFDNAGASGYTSVPTISKNWMEGEVTYQFNGSSAQGRGIISFSRRYTGRCVTIAYITNRVPTGHPTGIGFSKGFLGFQNVWDTMTGFTLGVQISGQSDPIQQMACTDVRVEDRADGWFRVTETYQSKMFPGAAGYQSPIPNPPTITSAPMGQIASKNADGKNQDNQQKQDSTTDQSQQAQMAQVPYSQADAPPEANVPTDVGNQTQDQTGMDPNYPTIADDPVAVNQGMEPFTGGSSSPWPQPDQADFAPYWTT